MNWDTELHIANTPRVGSTGLHLGHGVLFQNTKKEVRGPVLTYRAKDIAGVSAKRTPPRFVDSKEMAASMATAVLPWMATASRIAKVERVTA